MPHSVEPDSPHNRSRWYWRIVLAGIPIGLVCGTWGYLVYGREHKVATSFWSAAYHSVQMFALHMPHLERPGNLPLEIGRWAAALSAGLAVLLLLRRVFLREWRLLRLWWWARRHVVVCGLGKVGTRLALEFRHGKQRGRRRVVAIEKDATAPGLQEAERHGVTVVLGDARDARTLTIAHAHHAQNVLAVCSEDDTNIAIAMTVRELARRRKPEEPKAECLLLLSNPELRERMAEHFGPANQEAGLRIEVKGLDVPDMVARRTFQDHPLDFAGISADGPLRVHLVVLGTCEIGFALALKALQLCHFANQSPLKLTIVGHGAQEMLDSLRRRHPHMKPWYQASAVTPIPGDPPLPRQVVASLARDQLLTVAVCARGAEAADAQAEAQAVVTALKVSETLNAIAARGNGPARAQVLVQLRHRAGFVSLLGAAKPATGGVPIHAFGLVETLCNLDTLLNEKQDNLAEALHKEYVREQDEREKKAKDEGVEFRQRPAHRDWRVLPEQFRESNRLAADHLAVKLRALGFYMDEKGKPGAVGTLPDPQDTLAKMEHARWCAEYWLNGWGHGPAPRNDEKKTHPDLKPWDELLPNERYIDQNFIARTLHVVDSVGMAIYPMPRE